MSILKVSPSVHFGTIHTICRGYTGAATCPAIYVSPQNTGRSTVNVKPVSLDRQTARKIALFENSLQAIQAQYALAVKQAGGDTGLKIMRKFQTKMKNTAQRRLPGIIIKLPISAVQKRQLIGMLLVDSHVDVQLDRNDFNIAFR